MTTSPSRDAHKDAKKLSVTHSVQRGIYEWVSHFSPAPTEHHVYWESPSIAPERPGVTEQRREHVHV